MKRVFLLIIVLIFNFANSQEIKSDNDWILKLNALQLVDVASFPTLQFSVERKINSYFSVNTEIGYQIYDFGTSADTIFLKPKGFKANIEGRFYLKNLFNSRKSEYYTGVQFFYRQNQKSNTVEYSQGTEEYNDNFGVKKSVKGINLVFGKQRAISDKIIFESFIVFGYMDRKVRNTNRQYDENKDSTNMNDGIPIFVGYDLEDDSKNNFNIGLGFRIGYKL